jgi:hypothetical protein
MMAKMKASQEETEAKMEPFLEEMKACQEVTEAHIEKIETIIKTDQEEMRTEIKTGMEEMEATVSRTIKNQCRSLKTTDVTIKTGKKQCNPAGKKCRPQ